MSIDITNLETTKKAPSIGAGFGVGVPVGAATTYLAINGGVDLSQQLSTGIVAAVTLQGAAMNYLSYAIRKRDEVPLHVTQAVKGSLVGAFTGVAILLTSHAADYGLNTALQKMESVFDSFVEKQPVPQIENIKGVCVMPLDSAPPAMPGCAP